MAMAIESWQMVPLSEILKERKESLSDARSGAGHCRVISKISFTDGRIHLRNDSTSRTKMILIRPGDLVISGINAAKGAIAVYPETEQHEIAATIHYSAYEVDSSRADVRFLWWILRSDSFRKISGLGLKDGIKMELKPKRLLPICIPLPPLPVQLRMVDHIEVFNNRCRLLKESLEQRRELASRFMKSVIDNIVSRITDDRVPLQSLLVDRPRNGWSPPAASHAETGIPVLTLSAVTGFRFDGKQVKYTRANTHDSAHYWLVKGELLITRSNTPELVGHAAIYDGVPSPCICPDLVMKMTVDKHKADTRFIHYWLQTSEAREYLKTQARGASGTMKKIKQGHVQELPVPNLPIQHQLSIVKELDQLHLKGTALHALHAEIDRDLHNLMPAFLASTLNGM